MRTIQLLSASLVAAALGSAARAAFIYTSTSNLLPNTPNQVVKIYVSGSDLIQGENLDFQINTGSSGPIFTGVDIITGTIFAASNTGQTPPNDTTNYNSQGILIATAFAGHVAVDLTTTVSPAVATDNGLLATLLISTTSTTGTTFTLNLLNTLNGSSNFGTGGNATIGFTTPHTQLSIGVAPDRQWKTNGGGPWNADSNWTPFAPYATGDNANFLGALTSGTAVITLDGVRTAGTINFNDAAGSYDLQPGSGGSLLLDNGSQAGAISVQAGHHSIGAPIALLADAGVSVAAGSTLTISGAISGGGAALSVSGAGNLLLTGSNNSYGATNIAAGASVQIGSGAAAGSVGTGAINNSGTLTFSSMATPMAVPLDGSGTTIIDGFVQLTSTAASMIITTTGYLEVGNGGTLGLLSGGSISNSGVLAFDRSDAAVHTAVITGGGTLTQIAAGTTTLAGPVNVTGPTTLSAGKLILSGSISHTLAGISGAGSLGVDLGATVTSDGVVLGAAGNWTINGTQIIRSSASGGAYGTHIAGNDVAALSGTSEVSSLTFGASGILDIKNNGLIVEAASSTSKASLIAQIAGLVAAAHITSSTAATDPNYGLAIMDNADLGLTKFGGLTVDSNSIIVVQALKGDTDLNGIVDGADFDRWFGNNGSTDVYSYGRGDLDGNGIVDGADFDLWFGHNGTTADVVPSDFAGGSLAGGGGLGGPGSIPVPEPMSLFLIGPGMVALLARRRRETSAGNLRL